MKIADDAVVTDYASMSHLHHRVSATMTVSSADVEAILRQPHDVGGMVCTVGFALDLGDDDAVVLERFAFGLHVATP